MIIYIINYRKDEIERLISPFFNEVALLRWRKKYFKQERKKVIKENWYYINYLSKEMVKKKKETSKTKKGKTKKKVFIKNKNVLKYLEKK